MLIRAGREGERLKVAEVCEQLQMSEPELREDINVLNVVNFGGGTYVLYAEIHPTARSRSTPEPYSDTFDRPARLLPIEAKALVAAIDLIGDHLPAGALDSAREKIVAALGEDPVREGLQVTRRPAATTRPRAGQRARIEERRLSSSTTTSTSEDASPSA